MSIGFPHSQAEVDASSKVRLAVLVQGSISPILGGVSLIHDIESLLIYPPHISEGGVQINFSINQEMPLELVGLQHDKRCC